MKTNSEGIELSLEYLEGLEELLKGTDQEKMTLALRLVLPKTQIPSGIKSGNKYNFAKAGMIDYPRDIEIPLFFGDEEVGEAIVTSVNYSHSGGSWVRYKVVSLEKK